MTEQHIIMLTHACLLHGCCHDGAQTVRSGLLQKIPEIPALKLAEVSVFHKNRKACVYVTMPSMH